MRKKLLIVFTAVTIMGLAGCQKASQTEDLTKNSEQIKTESTTAAETTTEETTTQEPATEAQTPNLIATDVEYFQFTNTDEGIYITGLTDKSAR